MSAGDPFDQATDEASRQVAPRLALLRPTDRSKPATPLLLQYFDDIAPSLDTHDFVEDLLVDHSAIVIYGESNSGKTFFALDLALHVAAGLPWQGREVEHGGVVYVALEGSAGFANRIAAWRTEIADDRPVAFAAICQSINLLDPQSDTDRLIETVAEAAKTFDMPVRLIVIDTLSRALAGGNENAPDDMGALVMNVDRIRAKTKAAVLFVHHSGKDQARGARGHSLLRAAIDTEIEVVADDGSMHTATVVKQRELDNNGTFEFQLRVVELGKNRRGKPVTSCVIQHSDAKAYAGASLSRHRLAPSQQRALEVLGDLVAASGQSGYRGTPAGIPSVPENWWRERFYERAMPGAEQKAKEKAFRRAADALISAHVAGMSAGRVWVVRHTTEGNSQAD